MRLSVLRYRGLLAAALIATALPACQDELPTATGEDRFPGGERPASLELILEPSELLEDAAVFREFIDARDLGYLMLAQDFQGELDAHVLLRFEGFPDSLTLTADGESQVDRDFTFGTARLITRVDTTASTSDQPVTLRLWSLAQEWDRETVSWTVAADGEGGRADWTVPGGTLDALLSETVWTPGDTATADTLAFEVDSLSVQAMSAEDFPGLVITAETAGSRLQVGRFTLRLNIHPSVQSDTVVQQTVALGPQAFIFDPPPPEPGELWSVGGVTGDRTVLRIRLPRVVPGCDANTGETCADISIDEVTVNSAALLLPPAAVPDGYRPFPDASVRVRSVLAPELGRRAPLGGVLSADSIPGEAFQPPLPATVPVEFTNALRGALAADSVAITVALLNEPPGTNFGYAWFRGEPRLRLIYTLPIIPTLP